MSQVAGSVPGAQHEPWQVLQSTAVSTSTCCCVPKITSARSTSTRIRASWPRSLRDRGGEFRPPPPPPPKKVSKMSPKPKSPPKPPCPPESYCCFCLGSLNTS